MHRTIILFCLFALTARAGTFTLWAASHPPATLPKVGETVYSRYPDMNGPQKAYTVNAVEYVGMQHSQNGVMVQIGTLPALDIWWLEEKEKPQPVVANFSSFENEAFLEALAMKETGMGWDGQAGPCGELSKWQITKRVWWQALNLPMVRKILAEENAEFVLSIPFEVAAKNGHLARMVTEIHLIWLSDRIRAAGQDVTAERLATCWHFGASHARKPSEWGQDVANLYETLK